MTVEDTKAGDYYLTVVAVNMKTQEVVVLVMNVKLSLVMMAKKDVQ